MRVIQRRRRSELGPLDMHRAIKLSGTPARSLIPLAFLLAASAPGAAQMSVTLWAPGAGWDTGPVPHLVRISVPLPRGLLAEGSTLIARRGNREVKIGVRPLTWYPTEPGKPRSARCA